MVRGSLGAMARRNTSIFYILETLIYIYFLYILYTRDLDGRAVAGIVAKRLDFRIARLIYPIVILITN